MQALRHELQGTKSVEVVTQGACRSLRPVHHIVALLRCPLPHCGRCVVMTGPFIILVACVVVLCAALAIVVFAPPRHVRGVQARNAPPCTPQLKDTGPLASRHVMSTNSSGQRICIYCGDPDTSPPSDKEGPP